MTRLTLKITLLSLVLLLTACIPYPVPLYQGGFRNGYDGGHRHHHHGGGYYGNGYGERRWHH